MIDLKNMYDILGVRQDADRDEIEKRYDILVKRRRADKLSGTVTEDDEKKWAEINEAYRILTDHQSEIVAEPEKISPPRMIINTLIRKAGLDDKKINNFLHYHKFHILAGILVLIVLTVSIKGCINRVEPDLNLVFLGSYYIEDDTAVDKKIKELVPEIKAAATDTITISEKPADPQLDYTMRTKAVALIAAGEIDVFIVDKAQFMDYSKDGLFESLDSLAEELGIDMEKNKDYIVELQGSETKEKHLYGIDVSESDFFKGLNVEGEDKIAAIRINAKHRENAVKLMKMLLK